MKVAKHFEPSDSELQLGSSPEYKVDQLILKAFKVTMQGIKFLDIWEAEPLLIAAKESHNSRRDIGHVPPTPPAEQVGFASEDDLRELASGMVRQTNANNDGSGNFTAARTTDIRPRFFRSPNICIRPESSSSCRYEQGSDPEQSRRRSIVHRAFCSARPQAVSQLALDKLSASHDTFLGYLGSLLGILSQSPSSIDLMSFAQQAVNSCHEMLEMVERIREQDLFRTESLEEARNNMHANLLNLIEAAQDVFQPSQPGEGENGMILHEGNALVDAATECVRGAGECVAESRSVIERMGNYNFKHLMTGNPRPQNHEEPTSDLLQANCIGEAKPFPPEPSKLPPPPPLDANVDPPASSPMPGPKPSWSSTSLADFSSIGCGSPPFHSLLPPLEPISSPLLPRESHSLSQEPIPALSHNGQRDQPPRLRVNHSDIAKSDGGSSYVRSMRDSETTAVSQSSTRATSPDGMSTRKPGISSASISFSSSQVTLNDFNDDSEAEILQKTYVHELVYNKDGQISGGTLPALIERLTISDATPDATFVSTFFLTFRLFATSTEFAQSLIDRFHYVGEITAVAGPVRLRVYNVFKRWLESHWRNDCDKPALELIISFATRQLLLILPTAGKRLASLAEKVGAMEAPLVPRVISSMGKTNTAIGHYISPDAPMPAPAVSKAQLAALHNWTEHATPISILDFDPLEIARQLTIKESRIFCSIMPEELLATEWTKKSGSMAVNVRNMSRLSTDLANLVADTILQFDDPKKRAVLIKQWVKVGSKCLELANYDSLIAIICSLNTSTILRLKRTWELVSSKTKNSLEHLREIVDVSRNYSVLRQRLQSHVAPCLPFVGIYLTDLTFIDVGNQSTRLLPGEGSGDSKAVINFDKHMKTAKVISELQRFQIPYRFIEVPELQGWIQDQFIRVRSSDASNVQSHYRRSLLLEPREKVHVQASPTEAQAPHLPNPTRDKFELFGLGWAHKDKGLATNT